MLLFLIGCTDIVTPTLPEQTPGADHLLVVVPSGFEDASVWAEGMADKVQDHLVDPERWDVWVYDWSVTTSEPIKAAKLAAKHGKWLGRELDDDGRYSYSHVHFLAHSLGGQLIHAASGVIEGGPTIQETYLDPFGARGVLRTRYGQRHFGAHADYAEAYLNLDDGVPYTDEALVHAHNFDVTDLASSDFDGEDGHAWPIKFYKRTVGDEDVQVGYTLSVEDGADALAELAVEWPAGETTVVEP